MAALVAFLIQQHTLLNECIQQLEQNTNDASNSPEITLVLGNEACDIDSMVSALLWSYYKQLQTKNHSVLYIPILSIPQNELKLRKDAVHLFQEIDKSLMDHLFFVDIIPKVMSHLQSFTNNDDNEQKEASCNFKLNVHLMDHNALSIALEPVLGSYVNYIMDHHKDEGKYVKQCNNDNDNHNRNIAVCGSTVSLIIHHILFINKDYDISTLAKVFGALINAVILLDTGGFDEKFGKTTNMDTSAYKLFEQYNLNDDYAVWYKTLLELRINMDGFAFHDLLLKDCKTFKENDIVFGIPGLGLPLEDIVESENENLFETIYAFQLKKKLNMVPVMTIYSDKLNNNVLQRQLALFCDDQMLFNNVSNILETQQNKEYLGLQPIHIKKYNHKNQYLLKSKKPMYYQWWKMDVAISRKKLVPMLRKILSKL